VVAKAGAETPAKHQAGAASRRHSAQDRRCRRLPRTRTLDGSINGTPPQAGESIIRDVQGKLPEWILFIETGAGELFQAVAGGEILSSAVVMRAAQGAFYESSGTSPEGMKCGASQFLIYSIARALREESIRTFNFGGRGAEPRTEPVQVALRRHAGFSRVRDLLPREHPPQKADHRRPFPPAERISPSPVDRRWWRLIATAQAR